MAKEMSILLSQVKDPRVSGHMISVLRTEVVKISGNTCPRGAAYAEKEVTNPTRIVTSTVKVEGGEKAFVSVKTKEDIPKSKIFDCMKDINKVTAKAPIHIGDVVLADVAGTKVAVVATKNVEAV